MYTTQAKIEAYIGRQLTAQEIELLPLVLETVNQFIEDYTNRTWTSAVATRTFDGSGTKEMFLPDFASVTALRILDTLGTPVIVLNVQTDLVYYPLNKTVYTSIRRRTGVFPSRPHSIQISATWGSGALPNPVSLSATMLCANYLTTKNVNLTGFKKESIEGYSYEIISGAEQSEKMAAALSYLDRYKRIVL